MVLSIVHQSTPSIFEDFIYVCMCLFVCLVFREGRREGDREWEKHQSVAFHVHPDWGPNLRPRHCPHQHPFTLQDDAQPTEPWVRATYPSLEISSSCKIAFFLYIKNSFPFLRSSSQLLETTISLSVLMVLTTLRASCTWNHIIFVFLGLAYLAYNVLRVHPCCSICQNFLFNTVSLYIPYFA